MKDGTLIGNLWNKGTLPTVNTSIEVSTSSIINLSAGLLAVLLIYLFAGALVRRVS